MGSANNNATHRTYKRDVVVANEDKLMTMSQSNLINFCSTYLHEHSSFSSRGKELGLLLIHSKQIQLSIKSSFRFSI